MRVDPDGRRYVLHRALMEWVELLDDRGEFVRVTHPHTHEPTVMARVLFDCETSSINNYFAHLEDASFDAPVACDEELIEIASNVRVACPRAAEPADFAWSNAERALASLGWVVIYFGPNP